MGGFALATHPSQMEKSEINSEPLENNTDKRLNHISDSYSNSCPIPIDEDANLDIELVPIDSLPESIPAAMITAPNESGFAVKGEGHKEVDDTIIEDNPSDITAEEEEYYSTDDDFSITNDFSDDESEKLELVSDERGEVDQAEEAADSKVSPIPKEGSNEDAIMPEVTEDEVNFRRFKSQYRIKSAWDRIFEKYGRNFEGEADEIDLVTEKVWSLFDF